MITVRFVDGPADGLTAAVDRPGTELLVTLLDGDAVPLPERPDDTTMDRAAGWWWTYELVDPADGEPRPGLPVYQWVKDAAPGATWGPSPGP